MVILLFCSSKGQLWMVGKRKNSENSSNNNVPFSNHWVVYWCTLYTFQFVGLALKKKERIHRLLYENCISIQCTIISSTLLFHYGNNCGIFVCSMPNHMQYTHAHKPNVFIQAVAQLRVHVFICANSQAKLSKYSNSVCHKVWHIRSYIIKCINYDPSTMIVTLVCFWLQLTLFYRVFYLQYLVEI